MQSSAETEAVPFTITVADDRMSAVLHLNGAKVSVDAVAAALGELKIAVFDKAAIASAVARGGASATKIASGVAPVDERPAALECRLPVADDARGTLAKVHAGKLLATLSPSRPGVDGRDVFGAAVPFEKAGPAIRNGKNVALVRGEFTAEANGNLRLRDGELFIEPLLELHDGKKDAATQTEFGGDVAVMGHLGDGSKLRTVGTVVVNGWIGKALINAGGSLHVRSGINGRDKGRCVIGGSVWAKTVTQGCVIVSGDVDVKGPIDHSRIVCAGQLIVREGAIVGGRYIACGGVQCRTIGNAAGVPTVIEAGTDKVGPVLLAAAKMDTEPDIARARSIREKVEPLMKHLKTLDARQRERVTELMYEAEQLDEKTKQRLAKIEQQCRTMPAGARPRIEIDGTIFSNVVLRLGQLETTVREPISGKLEITIRQGEAGPQIVARDLASDAVTVLGVAGPSDAVIRPAVAAQAA